MTANTPASSSAVAMASDTSPFKLYFVNRTLFGGPVYRKMYGTLELTQAMLCHTAHAVALVDDDGGGRGALSTDGDAGYDEQLVPLMQCVPSHHLPPH